MNSVKLLFVITILCAVVSLNAAICHFQLAGDLDNNCRVDIIDLGLIAQSWLIDCGIAPDDPLCIPLDIDGDGFDVINDCNDNDPNSYPGAIEIPNDGIDQDCDGSDYLGPAGMVWVSIDDDGSGMTNESGTPISNGGFTGEMSKYETTNSQYCQFLNEALASGDIIVNGNIVYGANGSNSGTDFVGEPYFITYEVSSDSQITFNGSTFSVRSRDSYDMSDHPVVEVSWYGATAFCNYYGFRLPTEWEWQAVADYDSSYSYGCGTTIDQSKANYYEINYANPLGLSDYPYTSPVDHYASYGYGMNDMAGNVWEWTSSIFVSYRVVRGGSWYVSENLCTVAYWSSFDPSNTYIDVGFRVCR